MKDRASPNLLPFARHLSSSSTPCREEVRVLRTELMEVLGQGVAGQPALTGEPLYSEGSAKKLRRSYLVYAAVRFRCRCTERFLHLFPPARKVWKQINAELRGQQRAANHKVARKG